MLLARRLLTAGFVKKPHQHYGVVYVFCLTSSQNSPDQETRFILFAFLRDDNKVQTNKYYKDRRISTICFRNPFFS
jgi:hypothetical protein